MFSRWFAGTFSILFLSYLLFLLYGKLSYDNSWDIVYINLDASRFIDISSICESNDYNRLSVEVEGKISGKSELILSDKHQIAKLTESFHFQYGPVDHYGKYLYLKYKPDNFVKGMISIKIKCGL
jgi:hypothetical protein